MSFGAAITTAKPKDNRHLDVTGKELKLGDLICFAATYGQSSVLKFGVITSLRYQDSRWRQNVDPPPAISVISAEKNYKGYVIQANGKPHSVDLHKVIVLTEDNIPTDAVTLLLHAFEIRKTAGKLVDERQKLNI